MAGRCGELGWFGAAGPAEGLSGLGMDIGAIGIFLSGPRRPRTKRMLRGTPGPRLRIFDCRHTREARRAEEGRGIGSGVRERPGAWAPGRRCFGWTAAPCRVSATVFRQREDIMRHKSAGAGCPGAALTCHRKTLRRCSGRPDCRLRGECGAAGRNCPGLQPMRDNCCYRASIHQMHPRPVSHHRCPGKRSQYPKARRCANQSLVSQGSPASREAPGADPAPWCRSRASSLIDAR